MATRPELEHIFKPDIILKKKQTNKKTQYCVQNLTQKQYIENISMNKVIIIQIYKIFEEIIKILSQTQMHKSQQKLWNDQHETLAKQSLVI